MAPCTVNSPLKHDGVLFQAGDTIDLDAEEDAAVIEHLTASGTITPHAVPDVAAIPMERQAAIVAGIGNLDPEDAVLWSRNGAPRVDALEAVLGYDITADERNHAWEAYQAEKAAGEG